MEERVLLERKTKEELRQLALGLGVEKLSENFTALMGAIVKAKPAAAKGQYLRSVAVSSTMGPGVKVNGAKLG